MDTRSRGRQSGFSLIELLIVLAILGILVGVVAMSVTNIVATAKERGMRAEKEIVMRAMEAYIAQDIAVDGAAPIGAHWEYDVLAMGPLVSQGSLVLAVAPPVVERLSSYMVMISAVRLSPPDAPVSGTASPPFAKYLRRGTKYYFSWDEDGEYLTVYDSEWMDGVSY